MTHFPKACSREPSVREMERLDSLESQVLSLCSGERDAAAIAAAIGSTSAEAVFAALDRLADLGLIEGRATPPAGGWSQSRRRVLRGAALLGGLAAGLAALPAAAVEPTSAKESEVKAPQSNQAREQARKREVAEEERSKRAEEERTKQTRRVQESNEKRQHAEEERAKHAEEERNKQSRRVQEADEKKARAEEEHKKAAQRRTQEEDQKHAAKAEQEKKASAEQRRRAEEEKAKASTSGPRLGAPRPSTEQGNKSPARANEEKAKSASEQASKSPR